MSGLRTPEVESIRAVLSFIPAHDRGLWLRMGMAIKSALGDDIVVLDKDKAITFSNPIQIRCHDDWRLSWIWEFQTACKRNNRRSNYESETIT